AYTETLLSATADDGTQVPISVVYRADLHRRAGDEATAAAMTETTAAQAQEEPRPVEPAPLVLYGYGSYETSMDPYFSVSRLSLLDRGVVFAIAHVRGGGEMGRHCYDQGKTTSKKNTFTDFIAVARHLVDTGWTSPESLVATGGSAGCMLMGAVVYMSPALFVGSSAHVHFVDAMPSTL